MSVLLKKMLYVGGLLSAVALFGIPGSAHAAVAVTASTTNGCVSCNQNTFSFTVPSSNNRLLIVAVETADSPNQSISSVTYAGSPLTLAAANTQVGNTASLNMYYLANPPVGAANVVVTLSDVSFSFNAAAVALSGVNTFSPFRSATSTNNNANSTLFTSNLYVSSASSDLVLDAACTGSGSLSGVGSGQTILNYLAGSGSTWCDSLGMSTKSGATSVTMTWSSPFSDAMMQTAVSIKPASGNLTKPANKLGLVAYWPFEEGTGGKVDDFSGNGRFATTTGSPAWTSGKLGKALQFTSGHEGLSTDTIFNSPQKATLAAWVNTTAQDPNGDNIITIGGGIYLIVDNSNDAGSSRTGVTGMFYDAGGSGLCTTFGVYCQTVSNINISGTGWHHIAYVVDPANSRQEVYIDGVLKASNSINSTIVYNRSDTKIGREETGADFSNFYGKLDEVRIYNRALSSSEVAGLYKSGAAKVGASSADLSNGTRLSNGLVGLWTFDGADLRDRIYDRSGSNIDGYVVGVATSSVIGIGKIGQGLQFTGSGNRYMSASDSLLPAGSTARSMSVWIKTTQTVIGDTYPGIMYYGTVASNGAFYGITLCPSAPNGCSASVAGRLSIGVWGSAAGITSDTSVVDGQWHHIVATFDGTTHRLYIDGTAQSTTYSGATNTTVSALVIGGRSDDVLVPYQGSLDDARVYNRALSLSEVKQLYRLGQVKVKP